LQDIVTAARTLRHDMKLDPKLQLNGTLYARGGALEAARTHAEAIRKLAGVVLDLRPESAPQGAAVRSTSEFDLALDVPKTQVDAQRRRMEKEKEQLEKNIANCERQLGDQTFLSRAPAHVVSSLRAKQAEYDAQLAKLRQALDGLAG
jgi:valyl-tRNA synthetase